MHGDHTRHSTVLVCRCGARFAAHTRDLAWSELTAHQARAGCGVSRR